MHLLQHLLRTLNATLLLGFLGGEELEDDDEELGVGRSVLEDVSEGVCSTLVRPRTFKEITFMSPQVHCLPAAQMQFADMSVYVPKWLAVPVPDNRNSRHSIPNLQRKLVEVDIGIEEVTLVFAPLFKRKVLPFRLIQEVLLSLSGSSWNAQLLPHILSIAFCSLLVNDNLTFFRLSGIWFLRRLVSYPQDVDG
jgi:hypothetical protein